MNTSENYPGQNILISYLKEKDKPSYYRFLNNHHDIIIASITTTTNLKDLNNLWIKRFLCIGKDHPELNNKITQIIKECSRHTNLLEIFWQKIIKEYEENLMPAITDKIPKDTSNTITNFCYDILHMLENKSNINPFYRCAKKSNNKIIRNPMDLLTIYLKLDNEEYTNINEFEEDMHLIFRNCYTYNDMDNHMAKQFQILEQNKDDLVFRNVVNEAFCATLAYKNLVTGNIIPFIKNLKTSLLSRSQMSLFSADEPVLQAIVESLISRKYRIPELTLVMDGKKQKGSGRFGYADVFVIKGTGDNNVILELKYVSLVGLIKKQKNEYGANDLEDLDKTLEKEDEELLLSRPYSFWSKEHKKIKQIIISEMLENGINQLKSYMKVIAKGKTTDYSNSGIIDKRIKIIKSNPNKLKGFVILVIGFRRILWRPVEEVISNYSYYI
ncbi:hypothetical protein GLOIN_2v1886582 [Rhizophagus clarus]|uniref:Bromo domain-containing protein n=1 Tax=Rhizophagus clarus TaxID=94130 RepID=A0A8H3QTW8_9GLOM|nr:hypothetical protein GLOIN_2v1886582 [Rhizophagus clarus]